jgi:hypothetical protein
MSIQNFIDGSIPFGSSQSTATSTVNLTGAFNLSLPILFSKAGNMATLSFNSAHATETGTGGYAGGTINYPAEFVPAIPSAGNNVWGIVNISINNDQTNRAGIVQIQNGYLQIGTFPASGTTTNQIGLWQTIIIPYICS